MANALYTLGKQGLLNGDFDLNTSEMRASLNDHGVDAPVPATDDAYDDISTGTIADSDALDTPTITGGVFDAADEVYTAVSGASIESVNVREHNATPTLALLLVYLDTGTNLPVTPNGGNITVQWNGSGIFSL